MYSWRVPPGPFAPMHYTDLCAHIRICVQEAGGRWRRTLWSLTVATSHAMWAPQSWAWEQINPWLPGRAARSNLTGASLQLGLHMLCIAHVHWNSHVLCSANARLKCCRRHALCIAHALAICRNVLCIIHAGSNFSFASVLCIAHATVEIR
jgi:hypothetical protein